MEYLKSEIEGLRSTLDSIESRADEQEIIDVEYVRKNVDHIDLRRHDLLGLMVTTFNGLEGEFDIDPFIKVMSVLTEERDESLRSLLRLRKQTKYPKINYTPDMVIVKVERTEEDTKEDDLKIDLIDFTVTRDRKRAFANKFQKYNVYNSLFENSDCSLTIIAFDIKEGDIRTASYWDRTVDIILPELYDYPDVVQRSEYVKKLMEKKLSNDDRRSYEEWLMKKHRSGKETDIEHVEFDSNFSVEEFTEFIKTSRNAQRFFKEMEQDEYNFFWNTFLNFASFENDEEKVKQAYMQNHHSRPNVQWKQHQDYQEFLNKEKERFLNLSLKHKPKKGVPKKPSEEEITNALEQFKINAAENYQESSVPSLLFPIPINFSRKPLEHKGPILKKKRIERLVRKLDLIPPKETDYVVRALKKLLCFAKIEDEKYDDFKNGEFIVANDMSLIDPKQYQKSMEELNKTKLRSLEKMQYMDQVKFLAEEIKRGRVYGVGMKKGEVFNIKPNHDNDVDTLKLDAGVGLKVKLEDKEFKVCRKVKSLPFWDIQKANDLEAQFEDEMKKIMDILVDCNAPDQVKIEGEKPENKSSGSEQDSPTDQKSTNSRKAMENSFDNGLQYWLRSMEVLFENLNFVSNMASNGFRIVQTNTDNTLVLTMPSESLFKGETQVPYVVISVQEKGDLHYNFGDVRERTYVCADGTQIHVTMGRRLDRNRLVGYMRVKSVYEDAMACLNEYRKTSKSGPLTVMEKVKLLLYVSNININTSSILDNARYMAELCMADFSFCHEYITDKFMVPTKNLLQLHLFGRLLNMLKTLNKNMEEVRVRGAITDTEGNVNMESARITKGKFQSYFFEDVTYGKMESLISEIQCLFFSISKGLHGKFHNTISIHKTPLSIQDDINKRFDRVSPSQMEPVQQREEFNPVVMVLASARAEESALGTTSMIRERVLAMEKINSNPLSGGTTASTKSVLVKDENKLRFLENSMENLVQCPYLHFLGQEEIDELGYEIQVLEAKVKTCKRHIVKSCIKDFKNKVLSKYEKQTANFELMLDFLENKIKMNWESRRYEFRPQMHRETVKYKAENVLKRNGNSNPTFYSRGVVVTEVIKRATVRKDGSYYTIGGFAKECVKRMEDWKFGISPKGQRTQQDREIMILELEGKFGLYPLEHFYKQVCFYIPEEKISEPGDQKIISLKSQVESGFKWISRMLGRQKMGEIPEDCKPSVLHWNLDMTKWAPRDNLFKFIYTVISSRFITVGEKMYMMCALFKLSEKELYLDENIIYKLGAYEGSQMKAEDGREHDNLFGRMTEGFSQNLIRITLTWLQGQLNYISSMVHTGAMLLYSDYMEKLYPKRIKLNVNCHSDDQETSIYVFKCESDKDFIEHAWPILSFMTNQVCIEISVKKSFISSLIQLFVSQYNIGGEQVYLWIKSMMSAISGCPYDTLKNDISSVLSKVSESLSKGAPKEPCSLVIKNMQSHLLTIYGLRNQQGGNIMAELLGVEEKHLPTCLGGCHIFDYTTLAIAGPKSVDQMILMDLLSIYGADSINFGTVLSDKLFKGREKFVRSLKLFYVLDHLSAENPDEETGDGAFVSSLNPLRSIRFKIRRSGKTDPYWEISNEEAAEIVKTLKAKSPGLGIMKPIDNQDLVDYYFILCKNPNFRAALAGQSPNLLMMHKMANKHKGVFRLKESSNITLTKLKEQEDIGSNMTGKELCHILNALMDNIEFGRVEAEYLWTKYIKCDPEFKILQFVRENCVKSGALTKPNPFPVKKPNFDEYSEIVNQVPKLLCYLFDAPYCERNGIRLEYEDAIKNDVEQLVEIFPVEMKKLFSACKGPESETKYKNAAKVMSNLTVQERSRLTRKITRIKGVSDTLEKRFRIAIEDEIKKLRASGDLSSALDEVVRESKYKEDDNYDLADRLLKMSRAFKGETKKVLFCPPSVSRDFSDIALAMKSQVEGGDKVTVFYSLKCTQNQALRLYKLKTTNLKISRMKEFAVGVANLYSICSKLGVTKSKMKATLKTCAMFDLVFGDLRKDFRLLPRYIQTRIIIPLCLVYEDETEILMNTFEPMTIRWEMDETGPRLEYRATVYYMNLMVDFEGSRKRIDGCQITYVSELEMSTLNRVFKSFIGDLLERNRDRGYKYKIGEVYTEMRSIQKEDDPLIGYNKLRDQIVKGGSKDCNFMFKKMKIEKSKELQVRRRVKDIMISEEDLTTLTYDEGGRRVEIFHKDYKTQSLHILEFEDLVLNHMPVKKLIHSSIYRSLMIGDLNKVTLDQYIDMVDAAGVVTSEVGGYSACIAMNLFFHINQETDEAWEGVVRYLEMFEQYREGVRKVKPILDNKNEDLMRNEVLLDEKRSRWAEIMDLRSKFDLKYAESVITFFDPSNDLWEMAMESGVPLQDSLDVQKEMSLMDSRLIEETKKYELGFLLAEACPTPLTSIEKQVASACLYWLLIACSKGRAQFEQLILDRKEDKQSAIVRMKGIEKVCLQCAGMAISALEADVVDPDNQDFINAVKLLYHENRKSLGFGTTKLYETWLRVADRRKEVAPQIKNLMSMFMGATPQKEIKKSIPKKSYVKAASDSIEVALEARTSLIEAERLHVLSKNYTTGDSTSTATDMTTDGDIKKDVEALEKSYPGLKVKSRQKSKLAEKRRDRRRWLDSLKAPPVELKFEDLDLAAGKDEDDDDEIDFGFD